MADDIDTDDAHQSESGDTRPMEGDMATDAVQRPRNGGLCWVQAGGVGFLIVSAILGATTIADRKANMTFITTRDALTTGSGGSYGNPRLEYPSPPTDDSQPLVSGARSSHSTDRTE